MGIPCDETLGNYSKGLPGAFLHTLASEADVAAEAALTKVREVSDEGELIWEENAI